MRESFKQINTRGASLEQIEEDIERDKRAAQSYLNAYMGAFKIIDDRRKDKRRKHHEP